jgi:hypothetical protein
VKPSYRRTFSYTRRFKDTISTTRTTWHISHSGLKCHLQNNSSQNVLIYVCILEFPRVYMVSSTQIIINYVTYQHMYIGLLTWIFLFTSTGTYDVKEHVYGYIPDTKKQ